MKRRTWLACLGLLVAAGAGRAQIPAVPGASGAPVPDLPAVSLAPGVPAPGVPAPGGPAIPNSPAEVAPPAQPTPPAVATAAAVVGSVSISMAELEAVLKQADPVPLQLTERQLSRNRQRALGMLIDGILMRQFLETNTGPVDPGEAQRRLVEMEAELRKQDKSLEEFCQETRKTVDQLRVDIGDQLRWSAFEASQLTDVKLIQFYNENKDFFDGVTVRASHIVIRVPAGATEPEKAAAREKLRGLRKQLQDDPKLDFDEVARNQPDKGGDLGPIPRKWFDEQFTRAAFALPKGEVSDIVQTDFGLHLIKVTERVAGKPTEFPKMREAVREVCAQDLRRTILAQQRKTVVVKVNLP